MAENKTIDPSAKQSDAKSAGKTGTPNVTVKPPSIAMCDCHMHILSGNCSPMPFLWYSMLGNGFIRSTVVLTDIQSSLLNNILKRSVLDEWVAPAMPTAGTLIKGLGHIPHQLAEKFVVPSLGAYAATVESATTKIRKVIINGALKLTNKTEKIFNTAKPIVNKLASLDYVSGALEKLSRLIDEGADFSHDASKIESDLSKNIRDNNEFNLVFLSLNITMATVAQLLELGSIVDKLSGDALHCASVKLKVFNDQIVKELGKHFQAQTAAEINYLDNVSKELIAAMGLYISEIVYDKGKDGSDQLKAKAQFFQMAGDLLICISGIALHYAKTFNVQIKPAPDIAKIAVNGLANEFGATTLLTPIFPLPMDLEYAHLDRFSNDETQAKLHQIAHLRYHIVFPAHKSAETIKPIIPGGEIALPPSYNTTLKLSERDSALIGVASVGQFTIVKKDITSYYYNKRISAKDYVSTWLPVEEYKLFRKWDQQVGDIITSVFDNPWQVIPLYHYEPRRWTKERTVPMGAIARSTVVKKYADIEKVPRVFVGIKMYPSLGYKPLDQRLPALSPNGESGGPTIYQLCVDNDLPLMTHCSPGGAINQDVFFYLNYDYKEACNQNDGVEINKIKPYLKLKDSKGNELSNDQKAREYFRQFYASPSAWETVLKVDAYKKLRICLAHFGGSDRTITEEKPLSGWDEPIKESGAWDESLWNQKILQMIGNYENVYTDISYFFLLTFQDKLAVTSDPEKMEKLNSAIEICRKNLIMAFKRCPKLKDRLLYGSDWYMTEMDGREFHQCASRTKIEIDSIDSQLAAQGVQGFGTGNPSLWHRITMINPWEFYRLEDYYKNFGETLKNANNLEDGKLIPAEVKQIIQTQFKDDIIEYIKDYLNKVARISAYIKKIKEKQPK